jgi:hypothetical protein
MIVKRCSEMDSLAKERNYECARHHDQRCPVLRPWYQYGGRRQDDVGDIMKRERVRRLPVVDEEGMFQGIVAIKDFVLLAGEANGERHRSFLMRMS